MQHPGAFVVGVITEDRVQAACVVTINRAARAIVARPPGVDCIQIGARADRAALSLLPDALAECRKPLVQPDVLPRLAGNHVPPPLVAQLMRSQRFAEAALT